jgi:hypothetical protein
MKRRSRIYHYSMRRRPCEEGNVPRPGESNEAGYMTKANEAGRSDSDMPRLVWMVLEDGRSMVAGLGSTTRDSLTKAISHPGRMLTLTSDDRVEHIRAATVRDFVLFDAQSTIPPATSIYRLVNV